MSVRAHRLIGFLVVVAVDACSSGNVVLTPPGQHTPVPATPTPAATATPTPAAGGSATPTASPTPTPAPGGSATPSPTPSPTPTSSSPITLNPTGLTVYAQGAGCTTTGTFTASETGYSGNFMAVSSNTSLISVSPATSSGEFTVTSVTTNNSEDNGIPVTVSDTLGHSATELVNIGICLP